VSTGTVLFDRNRVAKEFFMKLFLVLIALLGSHTAFAKCVGTATTGNEISKMTDFSSCSTFELDGMASIMADQVTELSNRKAQLTEGDVFPKVLFIAAIADAKATLALIRTESNRRQK
jgi:hypothetical protein